MDIINTINLPFREDRLFSFCNQMRIQKAAFRIWNGVEGNLQPARNILMAHKAIIQWAKDNNLERVVVAEDDIIFSHPDSYKYFIENVPEIYDIYFGMIYAGEIQENKIINGFSGMTLYVCNKNSYSFFLSIPDNLNIDRGLGQFCHEKEFMVCNPYVCFQSGGMSNRTFQNENYYEFEKNMVFYNGS